MRTKGSSAELESRRRTAVRLLTKGMTLRAVAEAVGSAPSSVQRWKEALKAGRTEALKAKPHPGSKPKFNDRQNRRLVTILKWGPRKARYPTELWSCRHVAEVIEKEFGVTYHVNYIPDVLRGLGWSLQKSEQRAHERDEAAIAHRRWRD